jgi:hypothetical protein
MLGCFPDGEGAQAVFSEPNELGNGQRIGSGVLA